MNFQIVGCALFTACLIALAPGPSRAQTPKDKQAKALFDQGKKSLDAGHVQEACDALEKSLAIEQAINTHYQLGKCYEAQNKYATAHASYLRAATMARTANDVQRGDAAQKAADELKAKVASIAIVVTAEDRPAGLVVKRDDQKIEKKNWDKAVPSDAGDHTISAEAPGMTGWSDKVTIANKGGVTTVNVPKLQPLGATPGPTSAADGSKAPETGETHMRSGAVFGVGIGLIGLGGLSIIGAAASGAVAAASDTMGPGIPIALAVIGLGSLGAGIPLTVIFGEHVPVEPEKKAVVVTPILGPTSAGLRVDF